MLSIVLAASVVSFSFSLLWVYFIRRVDREHQEPWGIYIKLFLMGVLVAEFAGPVNLLLEFCFGLNASFFLAGFIEEPAKFLGFFLIVRKSKFFDDPLDGLVYASIVAIGFSFSENVYYIYESFMYDDVYLGTQNVFTRGVVTFLHVVASSIWGVSFGRYIFGENSKKRFIIALFVSSFIHGFYNIVAEGWSGFLLAVLVGSVYLSFKVKTLKNPST